MLLNMCYGTCKRQNTYNCVSGPLVVESFTGTPILTGPQPLRIDAPPPDGYSSMRAGPSAGNLEGNPRWRCHQRKASTWPCLILRRKQSGCGDWQVISVSVVKQRLCNTTIKVWGILPWKKVFIDAPSTSTYDTISYGTVSPPVKFLLNMFPHLTC